MCLYVRCRVVFVPCWLERHQVGCRTSVDDVNGAGLNVKWVAGDVFKLADKLGVIALSPDHRVLRPGITLPPDQLSVAVESFVPFPPHPDISPTLDDSFLLIWKVQLGNLKLSKFIIDLELYNNLPPRCLTGHFFRLYFSLRFASEN